MFVTSVNIGARRTQPKGSGLELTGIFKLPTADRVWISTLGPQADFVCDQKNHGGPDQAVFVYGGTDYAWWAAQLGKDLEAGTFGENLTISDIESARLNIGDRLHVGSVTLQVTAPRTPCSTLARRMGDRFFVKKYRRAERPGLYCRVLQEGALRAGDAVALAPQIGEPVSVLDVFRQHYDRDQDERRLRRLLGAPIAARVRAAVERDLEKLLTAAAAAR